MAKKQIKQSDLQKIADEIDNIGKENEAGHRQIIQTVAPPSKHTNEIYKKIMLETQERVKRNQEQSLQRLREQLKEVQDKISEPLKPIVKLQEKLNKDLEPITGFNKNLLRTSFPFNPFAPFVPKGGGLLGATYRKRTTGNTILGGAKSKLVKRRREVPDNEKRKPYAIDLGLNSYLAKHNLVNPVEMAKTHKKHRDYKVFGFMQLREVCDELNVNIEEAFLYICEGMTSNDTRWRKHRIEKEFWRGSESIINIVRYYYDKHKNAQSKGLAKYTVKKLHKSEYVKNIFNQNQAKVPSYTVFTTLFNQWKHHVDSLKLLNKKK